MTIKTGEIETVKYYLLVLGSYRALYVLNWIYRYVMENHYELIAIVGGVIQTVLYLVFFSMDQVSLSRLLFINTVTMSYEHDVKTDSVLSCDQSVKTNKSVLTTTLPSTSSSWKTNQVIVPFAPIHRPPTAQGTQTVEPAVC